MHLAGRHGQVSTTVGPPVVCICPACVTRADHGWPFSEEHRPWVLLGLPLAGFLVGLGYHYGATVDDDEIAG
jgi:hypothetical protein